LTTQFEQSLKQRQEVWGYFKSGAPGIETDGPYVLDKRDVWYMRHADEQHAGYAWQERGKTFIPVDLCYVCNELADIELLTECETCFAFVCIDCSCGCSEPGYKADALDFSPADPRNDKEWVERECKKIIDLATKYGDSGKTFREAAERYQKPLSNAERNYIDACEKAMMEAFNRVCIDAMFGTVNVTDSLSPEALEEAIQNFIDMEVANDSEPRFYEHFPMAAVIESDLVWDVVCQNCRKVYHIPQPEPGTIFGMDFTCDCGHPISLTFGEF